MGDPTDQYLHDEATRAAARFDALGLSFLTQQLDHVMAPTVDVTGVAAHLQRANDRLAEQVQS